MSTTYSGYTDKTAENLLLDAGAYFKNFDMEVDTFESAIQEGKLLGATSGGGDFNATPEMRAIEVDGVKGDAKGLQVIDRWVVGITANMKEFSQDTIALSLASANVVDDKVGYRKITANNYIAVSDYIDNITWVGKLSGSERPVIIQVYNALSSEGLTLATVDNDEAVVALSFKGHYDQATLDTPPFAIYYPDDTVI